MKYQSTRNLGELEQTFGKSSQMISGKFRKHDEEVKNYSNNAVQKTSDESRKSCTLLWSHTSTSLSDFANFSYRLSTSILKSYSERKSSQLLEEVKVCSSGNSEKLKTKEK